MKILFQISYEQFIRDKVTYMKLLKENSIRPPTSSSTLLFGYELKNKTISVEDYVIELNNNSYYYILAKGYNINLFTTIILEVDKFRYYELLKRKNSLVSLHTIAILVLNHITLNKLPI